jgi:hypothetical protein
MDGFPGPYAQGKIGSALYDLKADRNEIRDVMKQHPDVVRELTALAEAARADLGDAGRKGSGVRPPGRVK